MARSYRVELEVEDDGLSFTLDDAIKGVLDNTTYTLALAFTDITEYVFSVGVKRGRNRDLSRFSAGSMTVQLRNNDRTFDPLNTASPFYGQILPRRRMRVWVDQIITYVGFIEFWDFSYDVSGESLVSVSVNDAFTVLAQQELIEAAVSEQLTGARVNTILNNSGVAWSTADRDVDTGYSTLAAGTATGNALQYLQTVETSENGLLFIGKAGDVVFRGRNVTPNTVGILEFADDGTGIPYVEANVNYGTDLMVNRAVVEYPGGTAIATNDPSIASYGIIEETLDTLLSSSTQAQDFADYFVGKYGQPEYRFDTLRVSLDGLTDSQKADLLLREIGDLVQVTFTPNQIGSPIVRLGQITKLEHSIGVDRHDVIVGLTSVDFVGLILDDDVFGILDIGLLGY